MTYHGTLHRLFLAAALGLLAMTSAAPAAPTCKCRYLGNLYELGQCVCMRVGGKTRRACCGKVLNNTSWSFGGKNCNLVLRDDGPHATPAPWSIAAHVVRPVASRWQDIH
jgi:hypothetical protein